MLSSVATAPVGSAYPAICAPCSSQMTVGDRPVSRLSVADSSNLGMWLRWSEWIMWGLGIHEKGCRFKGEGATTNVWPLPLWSKVRMPALTTQFRSLRDRWTPDAARPTHIGEGDRGPARPTGDTGQEGGRRGW